MATLAFFKRLFTPLEGSPEHSGNKYQLLCDSKSRHLKVPSEAIDVLCDTVNTLNLIQVQPQQHSLETKTRSVLHCFAESSSTSGTSVSEDSSTDQKNSSYDPLGQASHPTSNLDDRTVHSVNSSFSNEDDTAKLCNGLNDSTVSENYDSAVKKECDKENEPTSTQDVSYVRSCNFSVSENEFFSADSDGDLESSYSHSSIIQTPQTIPKPSTDESLLSSMKGTTSQSSIVSDECASVKKPLKKKTIQLAAVFGSGRNISCQSSQSHCSASIEGLHKHSTPVRSKLAISFPQNAHDGVCLLPTALEFNGCIPLTTPTATPTVLPILAQSIQQQLKTTKGKIDKLKNVLATDDDLVDFDIEERLPETELAIEDHLKHLMESSWFKFAKEAASMATHDTVSKEICDVLLKKMQLNSLKAEQSSLQTIYNLYI